MSLAVCFATFLYRLTGTEWADVAVYFAVLAFWIFPSPWRLFLQERMTAIDTLVASFTTTIGLAEVVLCDLLTSYSRIIMLTVLESVWMIRPSFKSTFEENRGNLNSIANLLVPALVAVPFLLRFRQCVVEYSTSEKDVRHVPFWNACKYLTSLPVIAAGHYMGEWAIASRQPDYKASHWNMKPMFAIWYDRTSYHRVACSLVNSLYGMYWDVVMDWHLLQRFSLLKSRRKDHSLLRTRLQFPKLLYFGAMVLNTLLRCSWVLKCMYLATPGMEGLDVFLIMGEMFRRWVWVFFRLEREWFLVSPVFGQGSDRDDDSDPHETKSLVTQ
ncbi:protein-ER retention protein [Kappamyces sp. JEL0829]|nr:protein-ER retention protein [Kappamyces sp. JEL0829]